MLTALAAAAGGAAAATLARPSVALAGHDGTNIFHLKTGFLTPNDTDAIPTVLQGNIAGNRVLAINNLSALGEGFAAFGIIAGVEGNSQNIGVHGSRFEAVPGDGSPGIGVLGVSPAGLFSFPLPSQRIGVRGVGADVGVMGEGATGVSALSGSVAAGDAVAAERSGAGAGAGVRAVRNGAGAGNGVTGQRTGTGPGAGVLGIADSATTDAVVAQHTLATGTGLRVVGLARFATEGSGVVAAGTDMATVPDTRVTASSHITVTLTSDPGKALVAWVERAPGVSFTLHLSRNVPAATGFTYCIVEPL